MGLSLISMAVAVRAQDEISKTGEAPAGIEAPQFFSTDYARSRASFLEAAKISGARIESEMHPVAGPEGGPIFTDIAVLGSPDAEAVLFVSAGTHGVEAFAGAAIQTGLLRSGNAARAGSNLRIVLIHVINPFGFAHLRRVNEDNVDLNRNFQNHAKLYPSNPGYEVLATAIAPESISFVSDVTALSRTLFYAVRQGMSATRTAITVGQYTHPKGLFYGGNSETWSVKTLRAIVHRHGNGAKRVAFVDVHTGLGPFATAEIVLNVRKDTPVYERAVAWWGERVKTTKADESVSKDLRGTLKLAIPKMLPGVEVTAVGLEFGTVLSLKALRALRAENWLHHHGGINNPKAAQIKTDLIWVFYPDSDDWRFAVWRIGSDVVDKALLGLAN